ncbi:1613_t:CDS:2 [Scutellospora calospora]|uniref:1613_t:CDS:1 n=1 Tax=Scutellospora calospora TaxID=85575 RepID=A0ACA9LS54_9GLOM|nr:1613_t:CDS:2 [Scutellospora calospora]
MDSALILDNSPIKTMISLEDRIKAYKEKKDDVTELFYQVADEGNAEAQLQKAADNQNPTAIYNLGKMYLEGKHSFQKDKTKAK